MSKIYTHLTMDVSRHIPTQTVHVVQGDTDSRHIVFTLTNEGEKLDVSADDSAVLYGVISTGDNFSTVGTINSDGTVTVPIDEWMLVDNDVISCTLSITGQDGEIISTFPFVVNVHQTMSGRETNFTATAEDIARGKTAYVNGGTVVGAMPTYDGSANITENGTIPTAGKYVAFDLVVHVKNEEEVYAELIPEVWGDRYVKFTIYDWSGNSHAFQAEKGMTWAQWVDSSYSGGAFYADGGVWDVATGLTFLATAQDVKVLATATVTAGTYHMQADQLRGRWIFNDDLLTLSLTETELDFYSNGVRYSSISFDGTYLTYHSESGNQIAYENGWVYGHDFRAISVNTDYDSANQGVYDFLTEHAVKLNLDETVFFINEGSRGNCPYIIKATEYTTWGQWQASAYNTGGYLIDAGQKVYKIVGGYTGYVYSGDYQVQSTDVINFNTTDPIYHLEF